MQSRQGIFRPDEARATRISRSGSVRSEQRSMAEKELPPFGLRRIWPGAALLVGHRSTSGYAPSSRLATGQIRRNERHRNYVHDHLAIGIAGIPNARVRHLNPCVLASAKLLADPASLVYRDRVHHNHENRL